mgnify:CR=1 FL=1
MSSFVVFCVADCFVLEGREKTMCDSRFWLLRVLGVEGQLQPQQFSSLVCCWWELLD